MHSSLRRTRGVLSTFAATPPAALHRSLHGSPITTTGGGGATPIEAEPSVGGEAAGLASPPPTGQGGGAGVREALLGGKESAEGGPKRLHLYQVCGCPVAAAVTPALRL